jgi:GTP pyrophosphokinase
LNFVTSSRARSKIKAWFSKERKEEAIEAGKESIARQMRKAGLPLQKILGGHALLELAHDLRYEDIETMYEAVGNGHVSAHSIIEKLTTLISTVDAHPENDLSPLLSPVKRERKSATGIDVEGAGDVLVKLARCCAPVPGDKITGFITRGSGVSVHRADCINIGDLKIHQGDRMVGVKWNLSAKSTFLVNIQVQALDRARLLSDVTKSLSDQHVNILSASVVTNKDQTAICKFSFEMADASHLDAVLAAVRTIEGVYDVDRIFNN